MKRRWWWVWGPPSLVALVIFLVSSLPEAPPALCGIPDVGAHALAYCVLGVTLVRGFADAQWDGVTPSRVLRAMLLTTAYGLTDELHQWFVPGRVAEVRDLFADTVGAAVGVGLVWVWSIVLATRQGTR